METITKNDLKEMILLSYEAIKENKEKINKINVFPVPDQDTGGNLEKTLEGIKKAIEKKDFKDIKELAEAILDGALESAQGNAGVIYTGFLSGFLPAFYEKNPVDASKLSLAFLEGAKKAKEAICHPKEGTILDVINATAFTFEEESKRTKDIVFIFKKALESANKALLETKNKMDILKKADVVDAGGFGFLIILESFLKALEGEKLKEKRKEISDEVKSFIHTISSRYEVVFLIKEPKIKKEELFKKLSLLGNSIEVLLIKNKIKVHIHTDDPDEVKKIARESGTIQSLRVEDMAKEIAGEESVEENSVGIVVDETCDIQEKIIEKYKIGFVRHKIDWEEGEKLKGENIYEKMREADREGIKKLPKTAQASPKDFLEIYKKTLNQLSQNGEIISIVISSKLSGAYNSAYQASQILGEKKVHLIDSLNVSAGLALLILRAIELLQEHRGALEIVKEIKKIIKEDKVYLFGAIEDPKWLEAGGRMSHTQAKWVRRMQKIGVRPLIRVYNGKIEKGGIVFGAKELSTALFKKVEKLTRKARKEKKRIRAIINHCDNEKEAKKLKEKLKKIKIEVSYINLVSPIIGAHVGPGTLIVAWMEV